MRRSASSVFGAVFILSLALIGAMSPLASAETSINAIVCGGDTQPTVSITQPVSDSTATGTTVTVTGAVMHASSLSVAIDGVYDQALSLPPNEQTYTFTLQTTLGTHTLEVTAVGICDDLSVSATSVFTVTKATEPPGPTTPPLTTDPGSDQADQFGGEEQLINGSQGLIGDPVGFDAVTDVPFLDTNAENLFGRTQVTAGAVRPVDVLVAPLVGLTSPKSIEVLRVTLVLAAITAIVFSSTAAAIISSFVIPVSRYVIVITSILLLLAALTIG